MDNVTISDQFDHTRGRLALYDTYELPARLHINDQKHVDIRSFTDPQTLVPRMLHLDSSAMSTLNAQNMTALEGGTEGPGEAWTNGVVDRQTDRNNQWALTLTCPFSATTSTESVIPLSYVSGIESIDLLTDFKSDDYFSVALPAFPLTDIDLTQSWIDLTSHAAGSFTSGPTVSLRLDASTIPLVSGDSEYRRLRSALTTIDLQKVTGVRFRIRANNNCSFRVAAVRLLSKGWALSLIHI